MWYIHLGFLLCSLLTIPCCTGGERLFLHKRNRPFALAWFCNRMFIWNWEKWRGDFENKEVTLKCCAISLGHLFVLPKNWYGLKILSLHLVYFICFRVRLLSFTCDRILASYLDQRSLLWPNTFRHVIMWKCQGIRQSLLLIYCTNVNFHY